MATRFVSVDRNTPLLLPPDLRDWVPADHLAHFVLDAVEAEAEASGDRRTAHVGLVAVDLDARDTPPRLPPWKSTSGQSAARPNADTDRAIASALFRGRDVPASAEPRHQRRVRRSRIVEVGCWHAMIAGAVDGGRPDIWRWHRTETATSGQRSLRSSNFSPAPGSTARKIAGRA